MKLTPQQEKFAQLIADGMTQADAYRAAYNAGNMKDATIWKRASELMANGAVTGRVSELREALASKALWTREDSVQTLKDIALNSKSKAGQIVAAIKELNSMHGFNAPSKHEIDVTFPRVINVIAGRA